MDYRFTALLFLMLVIMAIFGGPAYPKNEYLDLRTDNHCRTGEIEASISQEDDQYSRDHYSNSSNYTDTENDRRLTFTYRRYLGSSCTEESVELQQEITELRMLMELMKKCEKVNRNPGYASNPSFALLYRKCAGILPMTKTIQDDDFRAKGNYWEELKEGYMKENPGDYMGPKLPKKNSLKMPPEDFILPEPKPEINE
jgi:hypothetical protein